MLNRFLVVGLGGSGVTTVRFLKTQLRRKLTSLGLDDLPAGWQMVGIDVKSNDTPQDRTDRSDATDDLAEAFHSLGGGTTYSAIRRTLEPMSDAIGSWSPWPRTLDKSLVEGAGQYRAVGRTVAVRFMEDLRIAVEGSFPRREHDAELRRLARSLGLPSSGPIHTIVLVVSSLAGGAGSGLLMDTCDVIRAVGPRYTGRNESRAGDHIIAMLYTPEVFETLAKGERSRVQANALASLAEIMSGAWNSDPEQGNLDAILDRAGLSPGDSGRRGPKYAMLIGSSTLAGAIPNEGLDGPAQRVAHFEAVGHTVASWMLSDVAQQKLVEVFIANDPTAAPSNRPISDGAPLFSSAGFASLGLGNEEFEAYATELLAGSAVARLLAGRGDAKTAAAVLDKHGSSFIDASGLSELGESRNQVTDAVRGSTEKSGRRLSAIDSSAAKSEKAGWQRTSGDAQEWTRVLLRWVTDAGASLVDEDEVFDPSDRAKAWAREVQDRLAAVASVFAARFGITPTIALMRHLQKDVAAGAASLEQEAASLESDIRRPDSAIGAAFARVRGEMKYGDKSVVQAVRSAKNMVWSRGEIRLRRYCAELMTEAIDDLIDPLIEALEDASASLHSESLGTPGSARPAMKDWATIASGVPSRLSPPPTAVLLFPVDDPEEGFVKRFTESITKTYSDATDLRQAMEAAGFEVAQGLHTSDEHNAARDPDLSSSQDLATRGGRLVESVQAWAPRAVTDAVGGTPVPARYEVRASGADLLRFARDWVRGVGGPVTTAARRSLRSALREPQFRDAFVTQLERAVDLGMPLVQMDPNALEHTHGLGAPPLSVIVSDLPLSSDAPDKHEQAVIKQVGSTLERLGVTKPEALATGRDVSELTLATFIWPPLDLSVFTSAVRPIVEDVRIRRAARPTADHEERGRLAWMRAARLDAFFPGSTKQFRSTIRGYIVANMLGLLRYSPPATQAASDKLEVLDPDTGSAETFPHPLLFRRPGADQMLPALVESMILAYVMDEATGALEPYGVLRRLGGSSSGVSYELGGIVAQVLRHGVVPDSSHWAWLDRKKSSVLGHLRADSTDQDARREYYITWLKHQVQWCQRIQRNPERFDVGPRMDEIVDVYLVCLNELLSGVTEFDNSGASGGEIQ